MKIALMSDLHLDHDVIADTAFLDSLKVQPEVDVLVLAGDWFSVHRPAWTKDLFSRLLDCYEQILVVPGNHDYWRATPEQAANAISEAAGGSSRIHLCLEPRHLEIKGQGFFGGTLWYRKPTRRQHKDFIDMWMIKTHKEWFFEQQRLFETGLYETAAKYGNSLKNIVVVSHHSPSPLSIPPEFKGSVMNHFFTCDMTKAITELEPKLWLQGHTHTAFDYTIGGTRVVCHPRSYPFEYRLRPPYEAKLIEI